jgi:hypothetical protein
MKKLEMKKMEEIEGGKTGASCFFAPFRYVLTVGNIGAQLSESIEIVTCWYS